MHLCILFWISLVSCTVKRAQKKVKTRRKNILLFFLSRISSRSNLLVIDTLWLELKQRKKSVVWLIMLHLWLPATHVSFACLYIHCNAYPSCVFCLHYKISSTVWRTVMLSQTDGEGFWLDHEHKVLRKTDCVYYLTYRVWCCFM